MKTPLLYGIGITFVMSVITLITHLLGYWTDPQKLMVGLAIGGLAGLIVTTVGIVLGTRKVREERGPGEFTYGKAFATGLLIALCAGLCGVIFNFIFFKFLVPNFADTQIEWTRSFMERMNVPAAKIDEAVENIRAKATLGRQLFNGVLGSLIFGTVISLITSAFLKRRVSDEPPLRA